MKHTWKLMNAVELNAEYPEASIIPNEKKRCGPRTGDYVQLLFVPVDYPFSGEWMWVQVIAVGCGYIGKLANEPNDLDGLHWGDVIAFNTDHVVAWMSKR